MFRFVLLHRSLVVVKIKISSISSRITSWTFDDSFQLGNTQEKIDEVLEGHRIAIWIILGKHCWILGAQGKIIFMIDDILTKHDNNLSLHWVYFLRESFLKSKYYPFVRKNFVNYISLFLLWVNILFVWGNKRKLGSVYARDAKIAVWNLPFQEKVMLI